MVFALWVLSVYELVRRVGVLESRVSAAQASYARGEEALSMIRINTLQGSILVRDAIIEQDPGRRERYRSELQDIRRRIEERLPIDLDEETAPADEREHWLELRNTLNEYWTPIDALFAADLPRTAADATAFLRSRVVRRNEVLRIVDSLGTLQKLARERHLVETSRLYRDARWRSILMAAVALVLGFVVAAMAFWHVRRLEHETGRQRVAEAQNRRDLERLSARLVHAQEEERRSLARELHDEVGQALTALKMEIGVAARRFGEDPRARTSFDEARGLAEHALQNVRDLSQLLHPSMLDDFGLPTTLNAYLRSFYKRTGIRTDFVHEGLEQRLPPEVELCAYRITQEAVTNVARHSGARTCTVSLVHRQGLLELTIDDDGRGIAAFAYHGQAVRGLGLIAMRERAQALSGQFVVEERTGGGTRVTVALPAPAVAPPNADALAG
jgi:signal transduction histidine kinase